MDKDKNCKSLYLGNNLDALDQLVKKDDTYKNLKKNQRFTSVANKMKAELLQCQDDQEKCYILCKRYLKMMEYLLKTSDDPDYLEKMYTTDIKKVTCLVDELKESLEKRYEDLVGPIIDYSDDEIPPEKRASPQPTAVNKNKGKRRPFSEMFIQPEKMFKLMGDGDAKEILIVDVRSNEDFAKCHIIARKNAQVMNISENVIVPGLSAHAITNYLEGEAKELWEHRNEFLIIILMDLETDKFNYTGSKIERMNKIILEWDINRFYENDPVILSGGIRKFVDCYPSEVTDPQEILCQKYSEIDELLHLDEINYPEPSHPTGQMKLKIEYPSTTIIGEGDVSDIDDYSQMTKSENESICLPSPRNTASETAFLIDYMIRDKPEESEESPAPEPIFENPEIMPYLKEERARLKSTLDEEQQEEDQEEEIQRILETDKAIMLEQARKLKPKVSPESKGDEESPEFPLSSTDDEKEGTKKPSPPPIDRSAKPPVETYHPPRGDGFTGLKNRHNNCFMNSILQCLKYLDVFKKTYVTSKLYYRYETKNPPVLNRVFAQVMQMLWEGTEDDPISIWPEAFKLKIDTVAPKYRDHCHEDAFEFFILLFNLLNEDCVVQVPRPIVMTETEKAWYGQLQGTSSFLISTFHHMLSNVKACCKCRKVSYTFEIDNTLMLSMTNDTCILQHMVRDYLRDFSLTEFACKSCKTMGTIRNHKEIVVYPDVLVVVLKRYTMEKHEIYKVTKEIHFPRDNLTFGKEKYTLSSIVHHVGSLNAGHYYASVLLDVQADKWVIFNDERIEVGYDIELMVPKVRNEATGFFYVKKASRANSQS